MDLMDALIAVSAFSVICIAGVGVITGYLFLRSSSTAVAITNIVTIGTPFFLTMMVVRAAEGVPRWEAWIGNTLLFIVYAIGCVVGFRLRRKWGRPLP